MVESAVPCSARLAFLLSQAFISLETDSRLLVAFSAAMLRVFLFISLSLAGLHPAKLMPDLRVTEPQTQVSEFIPPNPLYMLTKNFRSRLHLREHTLRESRENADETTHYRWRSRTLP